MNTAKKLFLILLPLVLLLSLAACGEPAVLTGEEIAGIRAREKELRAQLVGATWHLEDEPAVAVRFNEDGTAEEYAGGTVQWIEPYTFELRFCSYFDQEAQELTVKDAEYIRKYYDYSVLMKAAGEDASDSVSCEEVRFEGDALILGVRRYVKGADFVKELPEGLSVDASLLNRVLYNMEDNDYRLFFDDGTGMRCNGVFLDGTIHVPEKFYWGVDGDTLYMMIPTQPGGEGPVLQEVDFFRMEAENGGYRLTDLWSGTVRFYGAPDPDSDSGNRLIHNYEKIRRSMSTWGY